MVFKYSFFTQSIRSILTDGGAVMLCTGAPVDCR